MSSRRGCGCGGVDRAAAATQRSPAPAVSPSVGRATPKKERRARAAAGEFSMLHGRSINRREEHAHDGPFFQQHPLGSLRVYMYVCDQVLAVCASNLLSLDISRSPRAYEWPARGHCTCAPNFFFSYLRPAGRQIFRALGETSSELTHISRSRTLRADLLMNLRLRTSDGG